MEAIQSRGLKLAGWVANSIDPAMLKRQENIATLSEMINVPLLGTLDFQALTDAEQAARHLRLP